MMAVLSTTHHCGNDAIIPKSFKDLVFYDRDTSIELSFS